MSAELVSEKTQVTTDEVDFFRDNGYLVKENLINAEERQELQEDILKIARGKYNIPSIEPLPDSLPDDEALQRLLCVHQPHYASETIKQFCAHPHIAAYPSL
jgi:hypothetical protein